MFVGIWEVWSPHEVVLSFAPPPPFVGTLWRAFYGRNGDPVIEKRVMWSVPRCLGRVWSLVEAMRSECGLVEEFLGSL